MPSVLRHPHRYIGNQISLAEFVEDPEKHSWEVFREFDFIQRTGCTFGKIA
jgi:hypothetical protein